MTDKAALRTRLRAVRKALGPEARRVASQAIADHLAPWLEALGAYAVGAYAAFGDEVDLGPLVLALPGLTIAWPRVEGAALTFHAADHAALAAGYRGLREPAEHHPQVLALDVVLVPGVGFDRAGRRLGQGGGHYDRTIERLRATASPPLCVGVAFEVQVVDALPAEPHDQAMDVVVTERGIAVHASSRGLDR